MGTQMVLGVWVNEDTKWEVDQLAWLQKESDDHRGRCLRET